MVSSVLAAAYVIDVCRIDRKRLGATDTLVPVALQHSEARLFPYFAGLTFLRHYSETSNKTTSKRP